MKLSKKASIALLSGGCALAVIVAAANIAAFGFLGNVLDAYFAGGTVTTAGDITKEQAKENARNLCQEIEGEGIVLVENKTINGKKALPLTAGKVNVLGYRSTNIYYGGTGSGSASTSGNTTLIAGLKNSGFEVNEDLVNLYGGDSISSADGGVGNTDFDVKEYSLDKYSGSTSFDSLKSYSDTALLVIGRGGGEGNDLPQDMTNYGGDSSHHYLELSNEESSLLQKASQTFSNVVVLLNTANAMELGFLKDYSNVSALWVGQPGSTGCGAIGEVLNGSINPSGRFVDTYVYDNLSAPATHDVTPVEYVVDGNTIGNSIEYSEGIYVGYRWYETAGATGAINYDSVVQYPFGYGLSYTTFSQSITGGTKDGATIEKDSEIEIKVKVENTGDVQGKEVVQLYATAPYTDGGLEKASKVLVAFDKVDVKKESSETTTLKIKAEDLASYDSSANNGAGAYVLESGTYTLSLSENAHEVIDTITVKVGNDIVFSGDNHRSSDVVAAENHFADAKGDVTYLSRKNSFANLNDAKQPVNATPTQETINALSAKGVASYDNEGVGEALPTGQDNGLTLADMVGKKKDDADWDKLISQMSVKEMTTMIGFAGYCTQKADSIGKIRTVDTDGPAGLSYYMNKDKYDTTAFCIEDVIASTWNEDLAQEFGKAVGDEANVWGFSGWYAPGCNTHRTPFGGRNYEYFSEDGFLAGKIAANVCKGALSKGIVTYTKHFALNDQETRRTDQVCTWANEQSMRELYFRPFELAVKEGGSLGIMTSYNFIGNQWTGGRKSLCTELLRNEWGFEGVVITDYGYGTYKYMNPDKAIRAGNDMMLSTLGLKPTDTSAEGLYFIQRAIKDILYSLAQASYIGQTQTVETSGLTWRHYTYIGDGVLGAIAVGLLAFGIVGLVSSKKKEQ